MDGILILIFSRDKTYDFIKYWNSLLLMKITYMNSHLYCYLIFASHLNVISWKCQDSLLFILMEEKALKKGKHNSVPENDFLFF